MKNAKRRFQPIPSINKKYKRKKKPQKTEELNGGSGEKKNVNTSNCSSKQERGIGNDRAKEKKKSLTSIQKNYKNNYRERLGSLAGLKWGT